MEVYFSDPDVTGKSAACSKTHQVLPILFLQTYLPQLWPNICVSKAINGATRTFAHQSIRFCIRFETKSGKCWAALGLNCLLYLYNVFLFDGGDYNGVKQRMIVYNFKESVTLLVQDFGLRN